MSPSPTYSPSWLTLLIGDAEAVALLDVEHEVDVPGEDLGDLHRRLLLDARARPRPGTASCGSCPRRCARPSRADSRSRPMRSRPARARPSASRSGSAAARAPSSSSPRTLNFSASPTCSRSSWRAQLGQRAQRREVGERELQLAEDAVERVVVADDHFDRRESEEASPRPAVAPCSARGSRRRRIAAPACRRPRAPRSPRTGTARRRRVARRDAATCAVRAGTAPGGASMQRTQANATTAQAPICSQRVFGSDEKGRPERISNGMDYTYVQRSGQRTRAAPQGSIRRRRGL